MNYPEQILSVLRDFGEPMTRAAIMELMPSPPEYAGTLTYPLRALVERGEIVKVKRGTYALKGRQTLSSALDIPVKSNIAPVVPAGRGVELAPAKDKDTAAELLAMISESGEVKKYATVIQEIGRVLAV